MKNIVNFKIKKCKHYLLENQIFFSDPRLKLIIFLPFILFHTLLLILFHTLLLILSHTPLILSLSKDVSFYKKCFCILLSNWWDKINFFNFIRSILRQAQDERKVEKDEQGGKLLLRRNFLGMVSFRLHFKSVFKFSLKLLITLFLISHFFVFPNSYTHTHNIFTIMLDPAGDAQHAGRQINDCFERGITLQFVEKLKEELENRYDGIKVVLTRFAGETVQNLQNANFANRLDVDFYVSIHFYKESEVKPHLFLYSFSYNDDFITRKPGLFFCPYDQAHLINKDTTKLWANKLKSVFLQDEYKKLFDLQGVLRLPFKPLIGIKAPAVGIELGLKKKDGWKKYVNVFANAIEKIVNKR